MRFDFQITIIVLCTLVGAQGFSNISISDLANYGLDIWDFFPLTDLGIGSVLYSSILDFVGVYDCNFYKDVDYDVSQLELYHYSSDSGSEATAVYNVTAGPGAMFLDMGSDAANYSYHIYIPGFNSGPNATSWNAIHSTYQAINNSNIKYFAVNHTAYTTVNSLPLISYDNAVTYSYHIGKQLGIYVSELVMNYSVPIENIFIFGHSLGAHMTGFAASHIQNLTGQSLPRITGLDPARPCFSDQPMDNVIDSSDADYVDIMHCNAGELGWTNNYGSADFYPNGGESQPVCTAHKIFLLYNYGLSSCSHTMCSVYFALSLLEELPGQLCDSYTDYTAGSCEENVTAVIGQTYNATTNGTYYCTVN